MGQGCFTAVLVNQHLTNAVGGLNKVRMRQSVEDTRSPPSCVHDSMLAENGKVLGEICLLQSEHLLYLRYREFLMAKQMDNLHPLGVGEGLIEIRVKLKDFLVHSFIRIFEYIGSLPYGCRLVKQ